MSDGGDPQFAKRVGKIALGGAATMSSLCFQTKRSAVDDAGKCGVGFRCLMYFRIWLCCTPKIPIFKPS